MIKLHSFKYLLNTVFIILAGPLFFANCEKDSENPGFSDRHKPEEISHDELLDKVQYATFQYFWDGAEPNSGMARERYHVDGHYPLNDKNVVTSGGSGFGLMAIIVGAERGFILRDDAVDRFEQIIGFLENADRFNGMWPHWMVGETGEVKSFSRYDDGADIVETAFLVQGLLTVKQYLLIDANDREKNLAGRIDSLWREVNWNWHTKDGKENVLLWHWSPDHSWGMNHPVRGYDECLIAYILAASSPTHPISPDAYHEGWARNGDIVLQNHDAYGYSLPLRHNGAEEYGGPLFWAHYSYLGLDPRNLEDQYANYWQNNRNHSLIQYEYAKDNPLGHDGYGEDLWGITASYSIEGYAGHRPFGIDHGVIAPTAALSSFPYTPDESMKVLKNLYYNYHEKTFGKYGFYDALSISHNWFPQRYLAIDQGPIIVMIENHRSGMLWDLFMRNKDVQNGLDILGFSY